MYKLIIILLIFMNVSCASKHTTSRAEFFFAGVKTITLLDNNGKKLVLGTINFSKQNGLIHYKIDLDHALFADHFLSMKEMKCLEGPELWCHLAYPYENPNSVTVTDFRWLSHDLLFMYKKNSEFGANFYNGIYYEFKLVSGKLIGTAMALDLNLLAAPPEDESLPPITQYDIDEIELTNRWLPKIEIH